MPYDLSQLGSPSAFPRFSHFLFVDGGTLIAPADQTGSAAAPFSTVSAAFAAAAAIVGRVAVYVTSGEYIESVALPAKDGLGLIGAGPTTVIRAPAGPPGTAALSWAPTAAEGAAIGSFYAANFTLETRDATHRCLDFVSSTVAPSTMLNVEGAIFDHVTCLTPAGGLVARFTGIGRGRAYQCDWQGSTVASDCPTVFVNTSRFAFDNACLIGSLDVSWDQGVAPVNGQGRSSGILLRNTDVTRVVTQRAQGRVVAVEGTHLLGIAPAGLQGVGLSVNGALGPATQIVQGAAVSGQVTLNYPDLTGASALCILRESSFESNVTLSVAAGAVRVSANLKASRFNTVVANALSFGNNVDADMRDSFYTKASVTVGATNATVDRDVHTIAGAAAGAAGANVLAVAPPFPAGVAYNATVQQATGLAAPCLVAGKLPASVTADFLLPDAARTVDVTIQRAA
jgi:hypothetical protein